MLADRIASQRSQSIVEFAIVAPVLLLLLFGVIDFGRVIYFYVTLNQAVNEGARTAIRASAQLPTNADVETSVKQHAVDVSLANPCPNGPVTTAIHHSRRHSRRLTFPGRHHAEIRGRHSRVRAVVG